MVHTRSTLAVALAFTAGMLSCSTVAPYPTPTTPTTPPASDPAVDYGDPSRVCGAFAAAVFRVDTAVDRGPEDGYRRAAAYLDGPLAAAVAAAPPVPLTPQWQQWVAHRAYVEVRVAPYAGDALPPSTDDEVHHAAVITARPVGRDGWRGPAQRSTVTCTLRRGDGGWRVTGYETG